jgi:hypothetical protein
MIRDGRDVPADAAPGKPRRPRSAWTLPSRPGRWSQCRCTRFLRSGAGIPSVAGGRGGVPPANRAVPSASRAAEPGRDPGAAISADQLVGSGDRPRAVGVGEHGLHAHPSRVRQAGRARSDGGGDAGPRPRPVRTVSPCALRFFWFQGTGINRTGLLGPERTGLLSQAGVVRRSGSWDPPKDRTLRPAGSLILVREESCPVQDCSSGSGSRPG